MNDKINEAVKLLDQIVDKSTTGSFTGITLVRGAFTNRELITILNGLEALRPVAAGTHVIVPVEPSEAMTKAAIWSLDKARERDGKIQHSRPYTAHEKHAIRYRAMLGAI